MRSTHHYSVLCMAMVIITLLFSCKRDSNPEPEPISYFPVLETSGTHYDIGKAVGERFQPQIGEAFSAMQGLFSLIDTLISQDPKRFYQCYVDTVKSIYPQFIEELEGMADGSGFPFKSFFIASSFSEYLHLLGMKDDPGVTGCSNVSFVHEGTLFLAHNEDGNYTMKDQMFIVKAHPTGKPSFISFCYPGMVMGVAPSMNDKGIFYSGNYISGTAFAEGGVPAFFIERAIMEATTMEEAIAIATIPERAYCFHVVVASQKEGRIVGIEVAPTAYFLEEVEGFYIHTNHFIQPGMTQFANPDPNSESRFEVLQALSGAYETRMNEVTGELLTEFLSSHDQWINSPCSHGDSTNHILATLGSTLFDINTGTWRIAFNNPCEKKFQMIRF